METSYTNLIMLKHWLTEADPGFPMWVGVLGGGGEAQNNIYAQRTSCHEREARGPLPLRSGSRARLRILEDVGF